MSGRRRNAGSLAAGGSDASSFFGAASGTAGAGGSGFSSSAFTSSRISPSEVKSRRSTTLMVFSSSAIRPRDSRVRSTYLTGGRGRTEKKENDHGARAETGGRAAGEPEPPLSRLRRGCPLVAEQAGGATAGALPPVGSPDMGGA